MKCLYIILLMGFSFASSGRTLVLDHPQLELDTIPKDNIDSLFVIEQVLEQVIFLPPLEQSLSPFTDDSTNYMDDNGLKQGIWSSRSVDIGNCTNATSTNYGYYKDDKLIMSFSINHDNNACYPSHSNFRCTLYDNNNPICSINNVLTETSRNDYLWTSIFASKSNKNVPSINDRYNFTKIFFEENISKKRRKKMKFTYQGKKIPGDYYVY
ncbi:MAG: hypothetical protein AB8G11_05285 [Saprospiraceae bacterium]